MKLLKKLVDSGKLPMEIAERFGLSRIVWILFWYSIRLRNPWRHIMLHKWFGSEQWKCGAFLEINSQDEFSFNIITYILFFWKENNICRTCRYDNIQDKFLDFRLARGRPTVNFYESFHLKRYRLLCFLGASFFYSVEKQINKWNKNLQPQGPQFCMCAWFL